MYLYIGLFIAFVVLVLLLTYVSYIRNKLFLHELVLSDLFKRRNYQVVNIYGLSKNIVNKHDDIFKSFIELKQRDFSENIHKLGLE